MWSVHITQKTTFWCTVQRYHVHHGIYWHRPGKPQQALQHLGCMCYRQTPPVSSHSPETTTQEVHTHSIIHTIDGMLPLIRTVVVILYWLITNSAVMPLPLRSYTDLTCDTHTVALNTQSCKELHNERWSRRRMKRWLQRCGAGSFPYPGIRAVFWVASSQHTQRSLELLRVGRDVVRVRVVFICCHSGKRGRGEHKDTLSCTTVLTNDCSGREWRDSLVPRPRGGSDARRRDWLTINNLLMFCNSINSVSGFSSSKWRYQ